MTGMVERVARAIAKADATSSYEELARAAIEAMREPTQEMKDAGIDADSESNATGNAHYIWDAMINAALSEESK